MYITGPVRSPYASAGVRPSPDRDSAQQAILSALERHGDLTRGDLQRATDLTRSTLGRHLAVLLRRGEIAEVAAAQTGALGRPPELFRLAGRTGVVLVQSMGLGPSLGSSVCAVVDGRGTVLACKSLAPSAAPHRDGVRALRALLAQADPNRYEARAAVLAAPFTLALGAGLEREAVIADGVAPPRVAATFGERPQQLFERAFGVPALLANDSDLGALGEAYVSTAGCAQDAQGAQVLEDVVYLKVLSGLSAGIIAGGRLATLAATTAGDLDHLHPFAGASPIGLGAAGGCWYDHATRSALCRRLRRPGYSSDQELRAAVVAGDAAAIGDLRLIGEKIGGWLAGLAAMYSPQVVALEAALGPLRRPLVEGIETGLGDSAARTATPVQVRTALAGPRAELIGAVVAARNVLFGANSS